MTDNPVTEPPPPAPEETQSVEIHKPKPVHNWREFLSEVGVVVLGICIALAGEQTIEWLHWRSEVQEARKALQAEIRTNEVSFFVRGLSYAPCIDRQMREAGAILADLEAHRQPGRFTTFHTVTGGPTSDGEWQSQRAAQTLTHFPQGELAMMSRYYAWLSDFKGWTVQESITWSELAVLRNPPAGLGPSDFLRLHADLNIIHELRGLVKLNTARVIRLSAALGVPQVPMDHDRQRLFCSTDEEEFQQRIMDSEAARR